MKKSILYLAVTFAFVLCFGALFSLDAPKAMAQSVGNGISQFVQIVPSDPCQAASTSKISVPINITSATTTALTTAVSGKAVYVCGVRASVAAAQTLQFETGTGATCGTGTATTTGAFNFTGATNGPIAILADNLTSFISPKGGTACVISTTAGSVQGVAILAEQ